MHPPQGYTIVGSRYAFVGARSPRRSIFQRDQPAPKPPDTSSCKKAYQYSTQVREFGEYWFHDAILDGRLYQSPQAAQNAVCKEYGDLVWGNTQDALPNFPEDYGKFIDATEVGGYLLIAVFEQEVLGE